MLKTYLRGALLISLKALQSFPPPAPSVQMCETVLSSGLSGEQNNLFRKHFNASSKSSESGRRSLFGEWKDAVSGKWKVKSLPGLWTPMS